MMDDNKSKNYNAIIISLIYELLYENDNREISRTECLNHLTKTLHINIDQDIFYTLLEKSNSLDLKASKDDVYLKLKSEKYQEINSKVVNHSIEYHIDSFLKRQGLSADLKESIIDILYQSIYENVNSFTVKNIKSLIPQNLQSKFNKEEIDAFNGLLDENDHNKDIALFNVFLKAVEFAIITSGKGVVQFTKDIFKGKEYLLDSNVIFRLLGVGGIERQDSLIKLIESCIHQGIKFKFCSDTYKEVKRKIESSIVEIQQGTKKQSIEILEELIAENTIEFNNGFIVHYAQCKVAGKVKSPEQYQMKLLGDLKDLVEKYKFESINVSLKADKVDQWQKKLFDKKKELNSYTHYTKTAAKVDAINILLVKDLRGSNDYNYSDIVSFYLTTDRTLNSVLAKDQPNKIAETILPSQLFIIHNALSENEDERDYKAFNKFLKRRTTEFKYEGREVLTYIDEIRNFTTHTESIKNIVKAYSDKKYETTLLSIDSEPEFKSITEFAATHMDKVVKDTSSGNEMYRHAYDLAIAALDTKLSQTKTIMRVFDVVLSVILLPVTILLTKAVTDNFAIIAGATLFIEALKFLVSTKTRLYPLAAKQLFLKLVRSTDFYRLYHEKDDSYFNAALAKVREDINIWK